MNRSLKSLISNKKTRWILILLLAVVLLPIVYYFGWNTITRYWNKALDYNVNPWIFLGLLLVTTPAYYWSWYKVLKTVLARKMGPIINAVLINRAIWAPPWIYVFVFGENYPWWVRPAILLWGGIALVLLVTRAVRTVKNGKVSKDATLGSPIEAV